jgi:F-type H+-transporting ATPase subunit delta
LDQRQRDALAHRFEQLTGRKMRMRFSVDGGLIGGLVARIGSTVYDGSVRGQLEVLGKRLLSE